MKTMTFTSSGDFRSWLAKNHGQSGGILLHIYKKDSDVSTVTYAEALDQAVDVLCNLDGCPLHTRVVYILVDVDAAMLAHRKV